MSEKETEIKTIIERVEKRQEALSALSEYLAELESQLSLIFAASPDAIIFIHQDDTIIKVSDAVRRILGYDKDEMIGRKFWDFVHPEDIEKTRDAKRYFVRDSSTVSGRDCFLNRWRKKDGSYAKLAWRFSLYDDRADHVIGFATDVTHNIIENPFHFHLLNRAISLTKDGIVITDNTTSDNNIIYANPSFCKNVQYELHELVGKNCRILASDDREQAALYTVREAIQEGEGCEVLLKNFRKDKSVMFNHLLISPIIEDGKVINFIGISRDLTSLIEQGIYFWDRNAPRGFGKGK